MRGDDGGNLDVGDREELVGLVGLPAGLAESRSSLVPV
jgi:hypothetical protein